MSGYKPPEHFKGITLFYIEGIERLCKEQAEKIKELNAKIDQYKAWLEESCSCKGE